MNERGLFAQLACLWEVTARKPGNVHRYADFADLTYLDFAASAAAIAPVLARADRRPLTTTILDAVVATRQVARTNTNLGLILLLAPLAAVPDGELLHLGMDRLLDGQGVADARTLYHAIRLAGPGGMGEVEEQSLADEPTLPLRVVMRLAAGRDLIARQYDNGFADVLGHGLTGLREGLYRCPSLESAIVYCHLHWLAHFPDSLIARKRGVAEAEEASRRAAAVLSAFADPPAYRTGLAELDAWLRADGHARNPGTSADLVAACLFAALRGRIITLPPGRPWSCG